MQRIVASLYLALAAWLVLVNTYSTIARGESTFTATRIAFTTVALALGITLWRHWRLARGAAWAVALFGTALFLLQLAAFFGQREIIRDHPIETYIAVLVFSIGGVLVHILILTLLFLSREPDNTRWPASTGSLAKTTGALLGGGAFLVFGAPHLPVFEGCTILFRAHDPIQDSATCFAFSMLSGLGLVLLLAGLLAGVVMTFRHKRVATT
jgi:hypothetical protein